jgi:hypothetical protein
MQVMKNIPFKSSSVYTGLLKINTFGEKLWAQSYVVETVENSGEEVTINI